MKLIAFYLHQFHTFPENDEWWEKDFTEWTNVKRAMKLYSWQYQPRIPYKNNYYNLNDDFEATMKWQIGIAKRGGVYGFCFYHYWFKNGKRLLEKPVERFLENENLDINFCLSWANEPWTRTWDGKQHDILMPQEYGDVDEWKDHFYYLLPFFKDGRYIKEKEKPILIIYKVDIISQIDEMLNLWQELAVKEGIPGLYIVSQHSTYAISNKKNEHINAKILYEPGYTQAEFSLVRNKDIFGAFVHDFKLCFQIEIQQIKKFIGKLFKLKNVRFNTMILDYDLFWKHILKRKYTNDMIPGAFVDWDNSPRRGAKGARIFKGATPEKFRRYMTLLIRKVQTEAPTDMIFIDAWNGWGEGTYLEPDEKFKYGYLDAVREALQANMDK